MPSASNAPTFSGGYLEECLQLLEAHSRWGLLEVGSKRVEDTDQVVGVVGVGEPAVGWALHRPRVGAFGEERSGLYGGTPQAIDLCDGK